tara:strand:+ start:7507 stop:8214 length:708 start_codon:yes stop_codon:yes gene_type:complete
MTMKLSSSAVFHFLLLCALPVVNASDCMSHSELEILALSKLQPIFSAHEARLNQVILDSGNATQCISQDMEPEVNLADVDTLFSKMWLDVFVSGQNVKSLRYTAELIFEKQVWRSTRKISNNSVISLGDVKSDWQESARLTLEERLFEEPNTQYRALRNINKDQVLTNKDVAKVKLVETGQTVLATYRSGGITIEVKARALSSGEQHDTIAVLLSNQREPVKAVVQSRMDVYVQE